jgi:hypothetical protein
VARLGGREVEVLRAATTGEPADAAPGTVAEGARVAAADEWVAVSRVTLDGQPADAEEVLRPGQIFDGEPASEAADPV